MKIILLHDDGGHRSLALGRRGLVFIAASAAAVTLCAAMWVADLAGSPWQKEVVDAEVVAQWRTKLAEQDALVADLEQMSVAQSAAVGKHLADMKARLLRMEAIGAHMAQAADLEEGEFDFGVAPAQGGPMVGQQDALEWAALQAEVTTLSNQLRQRETELDILDSVLVNEEIAKSSKVQGRPVSWGWLSSKYGQRVDPLSGKTAWHSGVDFAGHDGSDVIAVASGVVTFAGERSGYGKIVEVAHADGIVTRYAHHKELLVNTGEVVKKGEPIGRMGSTGRSTGPHVHFEVLKNGRTVDPTNYVSRRS